MLQQNAAVAPIGASWQQERTYAFSANSLRPCWIARSGTATQVTRGRAEGQRRMMGCSPDTSLHGIVSLLQDHCGTGCTGVGEGAQRGGGVCYVTQLLPTSSVVGKSNLFMMGFHSCQQLLPGPQASTQRETPMSLRNQHPPMLFHVHPAALLDILQRPAAARLRL